MAVPQRLTRKLQQVLGPEATEDLVNLLNSAEVQRAELQAWREGARADFAEFRSEVRADLAEFRNEMRAELGQLRGEIATVRSDLMKWSFVFWVGAVGAIAALAGVLR